jgi:hypothetical protein
MGRRQEAVTYQCRAPALKPHDIPRFDAQGRASARRVDDVAAMTSFVIVRARARLSLEPHPRHRLRTVEDGPTPPRAKKASY